MSNATTARQFYAETCDVVVSDWPGELDFYSDLIATEVPPETGVMQEIACGTGRITTRLAETGVNIVRLDHSPEMLAIARAKSADIENVDRGRAWKKCNGINSVVQCIAVAPDFHSAGVTLAGTEADGLWRSIDGGRAFASVPVAPSQVNALIALTDGWLLSDDEILGHSHDGEWWRLLLETGLALTLLNTADGVWAGSFAGLDRGGIPAK